MSNPRHLDESMSDLRSQISALHVDDEQTRRRLSELVDEIDKTLGAPGDVRAQERLGAGLSASVLQFEVSHPQIAAVLNQLAEKLSAMGI